MNEIKITIFTPTYNRAYTLPILYQSLKRQTDKNFIWFIIDDGSIDNTEELLIQWQKEYAGFNIIYKKVSNGGKPRAINYALQFINTRYIFILDSDDYLTNDAVEFLNKHISHIEKERRIIGIGVLRGNNTLKAKHIPKINKGNFVDATNLERSIYNLDHDANELYETAILKQFPFETWKDEKFVPEAVSLNKIALAGYKLRWYNKVLVISNYLDDGMTKGSWSLIKNNPMGYAIAFNESLLYPNMTFKDKIYSIIQFIVLTFISKNICFLLKSHKPLLTILLLPIGIIWSLRRYYQLKQYDKYDKSINNRAHL